MRTARSTDCVASAPARSVVPVFSWLPTRTVSTAASAPRRSFSTRPKLTSRLERWKQKLNSMYAYGVDFYSGSTGCKKRIHYGCAKIKDFCLFYSGTLAGRIWTAYDVFSC